MKSSHNIMIKHTRIKYIDEVVITLILAVARISGGVEIPSPSLPLGLASRLRASVLQLSPPLGTGLQGTSVG